MSDKIVSLEIINHVAEIIKDATKFRSDLSPLIVDMLVESARTAHRLQEENKKLLARNLEWEEKYDHENPQGLAPYALTEAHHEEHHENEALLKEQIASLHQQLAVAKRDYGILYQLGDATGKEFRKAKEENEFQRQEIAELRKDAERYRYMRSSSVFRDRNGPGLYWYLPRYLEGGKGEQLDQAIDASIAEKEQTK